jgi:hypothetical protein
MLKRIYRFTTDAVDQHSSVIDLFHRLLMRGHQASDILPMFKVALVAATKPLPLVITTGVLNTAPPLFFHLPFHPRGVTTSSVIQATFRSTLLYPRNEPPLPDLRNFENGYFRSDRLIVAYHRPYNLCNVLSPRKFKAADNQPVSSFLSTVQSPPPVSNFSVAQHDSNILAGQNLGPNFFLNFDTCLIESI